MLVIAGAGSGKSLTIIGKVNYPPSNKKKDSFTIWISTPSIGLDGFPRTYESKEYNESKRSKSRDSKSEETKKLKKQYIQKDQHF